MDKEIRIGTRDSKLALWQANWIKYSLSRFAPEYQYSIVPIKTVGDKHEETPLAEIGDKGLFTKELEQALLQGEIHMAVHSMKDMPAVLPEGLLLGAVCPREMPNDVLVSRQGQKLKDLPPGAVIGTGSPRRRAQLLNYRPDLIMVDLRGNLDTRLAKLENEPMDAVVLAWAGLKRLQYIDRITEVMHPNICLPAVGQGAIGIELSAGNAWLQTVADKIDNQETHSAIEAERAFLREIGGGCHVPVGALGTVAMGHILLEGLVASPDGCRLVRSSVTGKVENAALIGKQLAAKLFQMGAEELLRESGHDE